MLCRTSSAAGIHCDISEEIIMGTEVLLYLFKKYCNETRKFKGWRLNFTLNSDVKWRCLLLSWFHLPVHERWRPNMYCSFWFGCGSWCHRCTYSQYNTRSLSSCINPPSLHGMDGWKLFQQHLTAQCHPNFTISQPPVSPGVMSGFQAILQLSQTQSLPFPLAHFSPTQTGDS